MLPFAAGLRTVAERRTTAIQREGPERQPWPTRVQSSVVARPPGHGARFGLVKSPQMRVQLGASMCRRAGLADPPPGSRRPHSTSADLVNDGLVHHAESLSQHTQSLVQRPQFDSRCHQRGGQQEHVNETAAQSE